MEFKDLGLSAEVLKAVEESGYKTPTPIQERAIPEILKGRDVLGLAQTGTGKTAGFTLPMIDILARGRAKARMPRSLILEPTRELAAQVAESFVRYGKHHRLSMALLIGGVSFDDQFKKLDRGVDVLIATPGRLLDHFGRGKLMLSGVQVFVIDEADRMLDMGFIPDIEKISKLVPFTRQTLFFSATMPPEIQRLVDQFLHNPVRIEVARPATVVDTITQTMIVVPEAAKREVLRRLIREQDVQNAIIFCNRKRDVDIVAGSLKKHEFSTGALHGDLDQSVRTRTLDAFRNGEIKFLVASDVAARGLDIPNVSHIFNFDVPYHPDDYVHRIGRTGRAGRQGASIMLATSKETKQVAAIETLIGTVIGKMELKGAAPLVESAGEPRGHSHEKRAHPQEKRGRRKPPQRAQAKDHPKDHMKMHAPQPHHEEAKAKHPHAPKPAHQPKPAHHVAKPPAKHDGGKDHAEKPSTALGDHMPAFLMRPVKNKARV